MYGVICLWCFFSFQRELKFPKNKLLTLYSLIMHAIEYYFCVNYVCDSFNFCLNIWLQ